MQIENWNYAAGITNWKSITLQAINLNFPVVRFGVAFQNYNTAQEASFNAAVEAIATWMQSLTIPNGTTLILELGNEESFHITDGTTQQHVRDNMRILYTACKAICTNPQIKITYTMANGEMFSFHNDILASKPYPGDFASVNLYSYPVSQTSGTYFGINIASFLAWFNNVNDTAKTLGPGVISEFGPDPDGYADSRWSDVEFYDTQFRQNLQKIIDAGVSEGYIYNFIDPNNIFGCRRTTGEYNPWWYSLTGKRKPVGVGMI
jgi:hypothetical protein